MPSQSHANITRTTLQVQLCGDFKIPSYPTITFGKASEYAAKRNVTHYPGDREREAKDLVGWVANLTSSRCAGLRDQ